MYLDLFCIRRIQTSIYSQNRRRTSSFLNQPSRAFSSKLISATKSQFWLVLTLFTASAKWKYKGCEESRKKENMIFCENTTRKVFLAFRFHSPDLALDVYYPMDQNSWIEAGSIARRCSGQVPAIVWRRHVGALRRDTNVAERPSVSNRNICHCVLPSKRKDVAPESRYIEIKTCSR